MVCRVWCRLVGWRGRFSLLFGVVLVGRLMWVRLLGVVLLRIMWCRVPGRWRPRGRGPWLRGVLIPRCLSVLLLLPLRLRLLSMRRDGLTIVRELLFVTLLTLNVLRVVGLRCRWGLVRLR